MLRNREGVGLSGCRFVQAKRLETVDAWNIDPD